MEDSSLLPSIPGQNEVSQDFVLPVFFYLNTGQSIIGLPIQDLEKATMVVFPYRWEMVRDREGSYSRIKPFYPIPIITVHDAGICYEAPPPISAEIKYLSTLLYEKRRELQRVLHNYGIDPEACIDFYKRRRMQLENPVMLK